MKEIKLTKNMVAIVDDEDFERVNNYKWCATKNGSKTYALNNKNIRKYMHHFIFGKKVLIDHIDGNGLNNCKSNLRESDKSKNAANSKRIGVHYNKLNKNWRSRIMKDNKLYEIGSFKTMEEALLAYRKKKKELFGDHAWKKY